MSTHNLIEAVELGATAHFKVEGKWNDDLMTRVKAPAEIPAKTRRTRPNRSNGAGFDAGTSARTESRRPC